MRPLNNIESALESLTTAIQTIKNNSTINKSTINLLESNSKKLSNNVKLLSNQIKGNTLNSSVELPPNKINVRNNSSVELLPNKINVRNNSSVELPPNNNVINRKKIVNSFNSNNYNILVLSNNNKNQSIFYTLYSNAEKDEFVNDSLKILDSLTIKFNITNLNNEYKEHINNYIEKVKNDLNKYLQEKKMYKLRKSNIVKFLYTLCRIIKQSSVKINSIEFRQYINELPMSSSVIMRNL